MISRELFAEMARRDEGVRNRVYDDATGLTIGPGTVVKGNPTIGVGRNVGPTGPGLRDAEIADMLDQDIRHYEDQAAVFPWFHDLDEVRATVVATMIFNLGLRKFTQFRQTIQFIASGEFDKAADAMLDSAWATQVGDRAARLAEMMRHGVKITR